MYEQEEEKVSTSLQQNLKSAELAILIVLCSVIILFVLRHSL